MNKLCNLICKNKGLPFNCLSTGHAIIKRIKYFMLNMSVYKDDVCRIFKYMFMYERRVLFEEQSFFDNFIVFNEFVGECIGIIFTVFKLIAMIF